MLKNDLVGDFTLDVVKTTTNRAWTLTFTEVRAFYPYSGLAAFIEVDKFDHNQFMKEYNKGHMDSLRALPGVIGLKCYLRPDCRLYMAIHYGCKDHKMTVDAISLGDDSDVPDLDNGVSSEEIEPDETYDQMMIPEVEPWPEQGSLFTFLTLNGNFLPGVD
jgi:hypothetical protein